MMQSYLLVLIVIEGARSSLYSWSNAHWHVYVLGVVVGMLVEC
jgi:hypothetical protein